MKENKINVGIAWFSSAEWQKLKAIADDRADLDDSYNDWVKAAEKILQDLASKGIAARKVETTIEELHRWCKAEKRKLDGAARSEYAAWWLRNEHKAFEKEAPDPQPHSKTS